MSTAREFQKQLNDLVTSSIKSKRKVIKKIIVAISNEMAALDDISNQIMRSRAALSTAKSMGEGLLEHGQLPSVGDLSHH